MKVARKFQARRLRHHDVSGSRVWQLFNYFGKAPFHNHWTVYRNLGPIRSRVEDAILDMAKAKAEENPFVYGDVIVPVEWETRPPTA